MYIRNQWGGPFENIDSPFADSEQSSNCTTEMDTATSALFLQPESLSPSSASPLPLVEPRRGWTIAVPPPVMNKYNKYVDLGCIMCKKKLLRSLVLSLLIGFLVVGVPIIVVKQQAKHFEPPPLPVDRYAIALHAALRFFNAQKSGPLPKNNGYGVPWRGDSGLHDGSAEKHLVGGYYDSGNNMKLHFPMAFSMTLLSWSVIEYGNRYEELGEYDHIRDIIKWGTDYLLLTFDSSKSKIDSIYTQVGVSQRGTKNPDDGYCWQRPEDMSYHRPAQSTTIAPDLGSEVASALAAASIIFRDDKLYSDKLIKAAETVYTFATQSWQHQPYSMATPDVSAGSYNSTGYWDEILWGASWMFYATGNYSYLSSATDPSIAAKSSIRGPQSSVFSWDNKLPAAQLILTRFRIFMSPGYPYEEVLRDYHIRTGLNMCSYLRRFNVFDWTRGGLILMKRGEARPLQYAVNAAFLATLFADYMKASGVPGWYCGPYFLGSDALRKFATSQINYILGANPRNISYLVGFGDEYPKQVHHRGASIPRDGKKYSCTEGWMWRDKKAANPNVITGAMVAGPDKHDGFLDVRTKANYTEPTLAGNAGVVAALVALAESNAMEGIDKNTIFSFLRSPWLNVPPPPPPTKWKP